MDSKATGLVGVLLCALCLTVQAQRSEEDSTECIPFPTGDWQFDFWQQTEPGNETVALVFRSMLYLEQTLPGVITGFGMGIASHQVPNPALRGIPVPTEVVAYQDSTTCIYAMTFFGTAPPFNDIIVMNYDGTRLYGEYVTMVNRTLTTTVPSIAEGTLLRDD